MKRAVLDGNIYNFLERDVHVRSQVKNLIEAGALTVVLTRTVAEELWPSPFRGVPNFFPVEYIGNTVGRCGLLAAGDSIGAGEVFDSHKGNSKKVADALIADAADCCADWLVTDDGRMRRRLAKVARRCVALSYPEFTKLVSQMSVK